MGISKHISIALHRCPYGLGAVLCQCSHRETKISRLSGVHNREGTSAQCIALNSLSFLVQPFDSLCAKEMNFECRGLSAPHAPRNKMPPSLPCVVDSKGAATDLAFPSNPLFSRVEFLRAKGAGSQLVVSACQHTLASSISKAFILGCSRTRQSCSAVCVYLGSTFTLVYLSVCLGMGLRQAHSSLVFSSVTQHLRMVLPVLHRSHGTNPFHDTSSAFLAITGMYQVCQSPLRCGL